MNDIEGSAGQRERMTGHFPRLTIHTRNICVHLCSSVAKCFPYHVDRYGCVLNLTTLPRHRRRPASLRGTIPRPYQHTGFRRVSANRFRTRNALGVSLATGGNPSTRELRAQRNPTSLFRFAGSFWFRHAARAFRASLFQDPPRTTRLAALFRPIPGRNVTPRPMPPQPDGGAIPPAARIGIPRAE